MCYLYIKFKTQTNHTTSSMTQTHNNHRIGQEERTLPDARENMLIMNNLYLKKTVK